MMLGETPAFEQVDIDFNMSQWEDGALYIDDGDLVLLLIAVVFAVTIACTAIVTYLTTDLMMRMMHQK